jgi:translation elongation factor EF-Tu-like GTPase
MVLACGLAACGRDAPDGVDEAAVVAAAAPRMEFSRRGRVPVRLDMRATSDGGRAAPFAGGYRVDVEFEGATTTRCAISRGDLPEIAPGSSHEVALMCSDAVSLAEGGSRGFRLIEDGREVGSGVVLP